jgi:hypothetical protein
MRGTCNKHKNVGSYKNFLPKTAMEDTIFGEQEDKWKYTIVLMRRLDSARSRENLMRGLCESLTEPTFCRKIGYFLTG